MDSNGPSGHKGQVQGPYSDLAYSVDGPSDLRPRRNSQGSGSGSRAGSPKSATSKEDQARDKQDKKDSEAQLKKYYSQELDDFRTKDVSKRLDLPPEAYVRDDESRHEFARRPAYGKSGKPIKVQVNQFRVMSLANAVDVYQYDVAISPNPPRPSMIKKLWNSATFQGLLEDPKVNKLRKPWLFDLRKLAWSTAKVQELRCRVNIDEERGRPDKEENMFNIVIRPTGTIRLNSLRSYLQGESDWNNHVLECMNFLDHAIREIPQRNMQSIKRLFFPGNAKRAELTSVVEVIQGMYASVRMSQSIAEGGFGLGINVNVANCAFWVSQDMEQLVREFLRAYNPAKWGSIRNADALAEALKPVPGKSNDGRLIRDGSGGHTWAPSEAFNTIQKLRRIKFTVSHQSTPKGDKTYSLKCFPFDPKYGSEGINARTYIFNKREDSGTIRRVSIYDYFLDRYNIHLKWPKLPVVETARGGVFPMEVCCIPRYNRYPFKLNAKETSNMIKFAVQRPAQRRQDIMAKAAALDWNMDPVLKEFGIKINPNMATVNARLLPNPEVQFGNGKLNPGLTGRWDLRGKVFFRCNPMPLRSWAAVSVDGAVDRASLENFMKVFSATYTSHGGRVSNPPHIMIFPTGRQHSEVVAEAYSQTGNRWKQTPQIIFFVLNDRQAWIYDRMKKNADCRWACISQMVQADHVRKAQAQYCSNVAMKVNSKLGGQTSRVYSPTSTSPFFKVPTMMIGVDVSHAGVGSAAASMCAMTVSMDKDAATYLGMAQTNGHRVEVLLPVNVRSLMPEPIQLWVKRNGCNPQHVFYFRDGVSEGQFSHVLEFEIEALKQAFKEQLQMVPKITVIIATKRHHVRFFPEKSAADRNSNPLPGTLVDKEVTHPFHYDFYLCSHVAIQGTARPVHYQVIYDEVRMNPDELQQMVYQQCYQYVRSTTPVSLHPAVYYAHLVSSRARQHENVATSKQVPMAKQNWVAGTVPKWGAKAELPKGHWLRKDFTHTQTDAYEPEPLLPMGGEESRADARAMFRTTMWYI